MSMISIVMVAALAVMALITRAGVVWLDHAYPHVGTSIPVAGATLNVVDLGPFRAGGEAAGPPIVLIHGASSNLEAMRRPLGDLLARNHRVILIDRPGHGWSTRERETDSTPEVQARMLDEALRKLGVGPVILVVHSLAGALGARMALDHSERLAGLVMLAPVTHPWRGGVGWYNRAITTPVIGRLLAYTITLPLGLIVAKPAARQVFLPQAMPVDFVGATATPLLLRPRAFIANAYDLGDPEASGHGAGTPLWRDRSAGDHHLGRRRQDGVDQYSLASFRGDRAGRKADRARGRRAYGAERCARYGRLRDRGDGCQGFGERQRRRRIGEGNPLVARRLRPCLV
jgi:pimeloyl-ACP methyl ester carboxylesterase